MRKKEEIRVNKMRADIESVSPTQNNVDPNYSKYKVYSQLSYKYVY